MKKYFKQLKQSMINCIIILDVYNADGETIYEYGSSENFKSELNKIYNSISIFKIANIYKTNYLGSWCSEIDNIKNGFFNKHEIVIRILAVMSLTKQRSK